MHGSCIVGVKPFDFRILSIIVVQSLGLYGYPWSACCTGSAYPFGIGGLPLTFSHHSLYYLYIVAYSGVEGGDVSAKALVVSVLYAL